MKLIDNLFALIELFDKRFVLSSAFYRLSSLAKRIEFILKIILLNAEQIRNFSSTIRKLDQPNSVALNDQTIIELLNHPQHIESLKEWLDNFVVRNNNFISPLTLTADIPPIVIKLLKKCPEHAENISDALYALKRLGLLEPEYADSTVTHILELNKLENDSRRHIRIFVDVIIRLKLNDESGISPSDQFNNIMTLTKRDDWEILGPLIEKNRATPSMIATLITLPAPYAKKYAEAIRNLKRENTQIPEAQIANRYIHLLSGKDAIQYANTLALGINYLMHAEVDTPDNIKLLFDNKSIADKIGQSIGSLMIAIKNCNLLNQHLTEIRRVCLADTVNMVPLTAGIITLYQIAQRHSQYQESLQNNILFMQNNAQYGHDFADCITHMTALRLSIPDYFQFFLDNIQYTPRLAKALKALSNCRTLTTEYFDLLIEHKEYSDKLIAGIILLYYKDQLTEVSKQLLITHRECADDYANGILAILQYAEDNEGPEYLPIIQLLKNNVQYAHKLILLIKQLSKDLNIGRSLIERLRPHIHYTNELFQMFKVLSKDKKITLATLQLIIHFLEKKVSTSQNEITQLRKTLNTLTFAFASFASQSTLTTQLIHELMSNPHHALVIVGKTVYLDGKDPIPRMMISMANASQSVIWIHQHNLLTQPILRIILFYLYAAEDSNSVDNASKKTFLTAALTHAKNHLLLTDNSSFVSILPRVTRHKIG